jgi:hypothetical protein
VKEYRSENRNVCQYQNKYLRYDITKRILSKQYERPITLISPHWHEKPKDFKMNRLKNSLQIFADV